MNQNAVIGCVLGTAVGDALGLPYEGLSLARAATLLGPPDRHRFVFGRGMVSDDTEHACFTAMSLIKAQGDPDVFTHVLARSFRWWLLSGPAGVGLGTARAIAKLWLGFSPYKSGVFSAGNGPAMRSPILGVAFADDAKKMTEFVKRSTCITHSDPKAYYGALCVALAASISARQNPVAPSDFFSSVQQALKKDSDELSKLIEQACISAEANESVNKFARQIGSKRGISGYIYHTVPCVIQTWLRYQEDFPGGIQEIIAAGGDTDTTAAILGGILGAGVRKEGIPTQWLDGITEWPRSVRWIEELGFALARSVQVQNVEPPRYEVSGVIPRNILFLMIVLGHGLRRLGPPY